MSQADITLRGLSLGAGMAESIARERLERKRREEEQRNRLETERLARMRVFEQLLEQQRKREESLEKALREREEREASAKFAEAFAGGWPEGFDRAGAGAVAPNLLLEYVRHIGREQAREAIRKADLEEKQKTLERLFSMKKTIEERLRSVHPDSILAPRLIDEKIRIEREIINKGGEVVDTDLSGVPFVPRFSGESAKSAADPEALRDEVLKARVKFAAAREIDEKTALLEVVNENRRRHVKLASGVDPGDIHEASMREAMLKWRRGLPRGAPDQPTSRDSMTILKAADEEADRIYRRLLTGGAAPRQREEDPVSDLTPAEIAAVTMLVAEGADFDDAVEQVRSLRHAGNP